MNNQLFKNQSISSKALSLLVLLTWGAAFFIYIRGFYTRLFPLDMVEWINPVIVWILIFISIRDIVKAIRYTDILFYIIICAVFYWEYNTHPQAQLLLNGYESLFLVSAIPCYFTGLCVSQKDYSKGFYWMSIFSITLMAIRSFILGSYSEAAIESNNEHMAEAYLVLPHAIYMLYSYFKEHRYVTLFFAVLSLYMLLSFGSRGAFLSYISFIVLYFVVKLNKSDIRRNIGWGIGLGIVLIPIFIYSNDIVMGIAMFFNDIMPHNRISESIISNAFVNYGESNGRDVIHETIFDELNRGNHPLGLGLCGDRLITKFGEYSHNIVIELWASFGYVIGSCIITLLAFLIFKAFKSCESMKDKEYLAIMFLVGLFPLFFSSTFLDWPMLYFLIGYCVSLIRKKKLSNE